MGWFGDVDIRRADGPKAFRSGALASVCMRAAPVTWPLHPFLFAAASVLALMSRNLFQTSFADVAPALAGTLIFALLVYLAVAALRRRRDAATAVIASVWVVGALYYAGLLEGLNAAFGGAGTVVMSLPVVVAALCLLTVACHYLGRALPVVHVVLNGIAVVMLATPLWQATTYAWHEWDARAVYDADRAAAELPQIAQAPDAGTARPPDIYHFVFDRYGSEAMLARHYGIAGTTGRFLEERGFYVAPASNSNYLKTGHSLASTFYMDYLDPLADGAVDGRNWHPIFEMLDDHRAARFLRARGYDFLQFGSWWVGTFDNWAADENHPLGFSEFDMIYLRRTALRPLFQLLPDTSFTRRLDWDNGQCQRVARQVEMVKSIGVRPRPVYVFVHILVPHGPFPFAPDGRCLSREEAAERGDPQGYVDQVAYAGRIIEDVVTALQADDRPAPVILIQADEGPFPDRDYSVPWQDAPAEELRIKTGILNAFFFPSGDYHLLRPDITPVNSYRIVFNTLFDAEFPILPDRILAFPNDQNLYDFHDVTGRVRSGLVGSTLDAQGAGDAGYPGAYDGRNGSLPALATQD